MNWIEKLPNPWRKPKPDVTNAEYIYTNLRQLVNTLHHHFKATNQDAAYIVSSSAELHTMITELIGAAASSTTGHNLTIDYRNACTESSREVLFVWRKGEYDPIVVNYAAEKEVTDLLDSNPRVYRIAEVLTLPLYRGFVQLQALEEYAEQVYRKVKDPDAFAFYLNRYFKEHEADHFTTDLVDQLSRNQAFVDYCVKIRVIGQDKTLCDAFLRKDKEWLTEFFRPVEAVYPFIASTTNDEQLQQQADQQLEQLISWNSTQLHAIQPTPSSEQRPLLDGMLLEAFKGMDNT